MAILEEDVTKVRLASNLVDIAGEHIALKKVGRRWTGLCPFHSENSPSFSVNGEESLYYCFGCQAKGDVITFVQEIDHLTFVEAVEKLATKAGIELRYDNVAVSNDRKKRSRLKEVMLIAVDWYHQRLLTSPDAAAARSYLRERGYDGDIVRQFKIGWAPDGWDELSRFLGLPGNVLKDCGLGFVNKRGRLQDSFRGRIVFPIYDVADSPVAFGGRILPGAEGPKYKNSSETSLYNKSRTLYALNWAKADIVEHDQVIVCEGYTDVIGFFQAGLPRAVATCGTALTEDHVRTLTNFAKKIVLAYDADSAGQAAAERFYEWERKLGVDIFVATFPNGSDPAEVAKQNPDLLREAVVNAQSFLSFRLGRVLKTADLETVEGRSRAAERCISIIAEHPNVLHHDQYLLNVASQCRIPEARLTDMLNKTLRGREHRESSDRREVNSKRGISFNVDAASSRNIGHVLDVRNRPTTKALSPAEYEALRAAIHQPEDVAKLLEEIVDGSMEGVQEVFFTDARAQQAFKSLTTSATLHDAINYSDPEVADLLNRIAVADSSDCDATSFVRLIDSAACRAIAELELEARANIEAFSEISPIISRLKPYVEELRNGSTDATRNLLEWLRNGGWATS